MARKLRMWEMTPDSALEGTVMVSGEAITPGEWRTTSRIRWTAQRV
jgi:hypothetical protein